MLAERPVLSSHSVFLLLAVAMLPRKHASLNPAAHEVKRVEACDEQEEQEEDEDEAAIGATQEKKDLHQTLQEFMSTAGKI